MRVIRPIRSRKTPRMRRSRDATPLAAGGIRLVSAGYFKPFSVRRESVPAPVQPLTGWSASSERTSDVP